MPPLIPIHSWKTWLYGLARRIIAGVSMAVSATFGVSAAHSAGVEVQVIDWSQTGIVALSALTISACAYLMQHPLPAKDSDGDGKEEDEDK